MWAFWGLGHIANFDCAGACWWFVTPGVTVHLSAEPCAALVHSMDGVPHRTDARTGSTYWRRVSVLQSVADVMRRGRCVARRWLCVVVLAVRHLPACAGHMRGPPCARQLVSIKGCRRCVARVVAGWPEGGWFVFGVCGASTRGSVSPGFNMLGLAGILECHALQCSQGRQPLPRYCPSRCGWAGKQ